MKKIIKIIREKGFSWLYWRLKTELRTPTNPISISFIDRWLTFRRKISRLQVNDEKNNYLYAIFDLKIAPITFNIVEFLVASEYEAKRSGKKGFVVVFVPQDDDGAYGWDEYDSIYDKESKFWRFTNIVLSATLLAPRCNGFHLLPDRSSVVNFIKNRSVYPHLYDGVNLRYLDISEFYKTFDRPHMVEGLRATAQGLKYIQDWSRKQSIKGRIVTITLRQNDWDQSRNSNISEWLKFARYLQGTEYFPVIIPDTDKAYGVENLFPGVSIFNEGSWNMGLRMAIYESSYVNFFVSTGPLLLTIWNDRCSYIAMNQLAEGSLIDTEESHKVTGIGKSRHYKFALPNQRLNWQLDTYDNILGEFECFVEDDKNKLFKEI